MTDIALIWNGDAWGGDIAVAGGDLVADDGMHTAILLSLFLNAPARADDVLPPGVDRQGWWGDALAEVPGDVTGSRLWLLNREKQLSSVLDKAQSYAAEALQWLIDGQIAASVTVTATNPAPMPGSGGGVLALSVTITRPAASGRQTYDFIWEATK